MSNRYTGSRLINARRKEREPWRTASAAVAAGAGALTLGAAFSAPVVASANASTPASPRAHTRFLDRDEGAIAYDDEGSGPLVVLVPGMGDVRATYRFLKPALVTAGFRVVAMDVRGHGESGTGFSDYSTSAVGSDVVALVRHLNAGPAVVIGGSMGAGAAAWAAAEDPVRVQGLVLIAPFVREGTPLPLGKTGTRLLFRALFARPWGPWVWSTYLTNNLFPSAKPQDQATYKRHLQRNLTEKGRMEAFQRMMSYSKEDVERRLPEVKAPVLVVMGTKDPDFVDPAAEANAVATLLRGDVVLIEGAGHYPHAEMPERTIPPILGFLQSLAKPISESAA